MPSQIKIFLICLSCGVLSGVVYDFLYIIRRALSGKSFAGENNINAGAAKINAGTPHKDAADPKINAAAPRLKLRADRARAFIVTAVCDILFALALSLMFVCASVTFCFPDVRLYMFAAVAIGFVLYVKSFHIIVAFFVNRLYNSIGRIVKVGKRGKKGARRRRKTNKFAVKEVNE